jgi:hypothetical protein
MLTRTLLLTASLMLLGSAQAMIVSGNVDLYSGIQKYKSDRVFEFVSRMSRSAAKVERSSVDTSTISFGSNHLALVDKTLEELILRHPRELTNVSVTFFTDNATSAKELSSAKVLMDMGSNVRFEEGSLPCVENAHLYDGFKCKIFVIQFHATRLGGFDE